MATPTDQDREKARMILEAYPHLCERTGVLKLGWRNLGNAIARGLADEREAAFIEGKIAAVERASSGLPGDRDREVWERGYWAGQRVFAGALADAAKAEGKHSVSCDLLRAARVEPPPSEAKPCAGS